MSLKSTIATKYKTLKILGENLNQGRKTYLVEDSKSQKFVLKEFTFNREGNWRAFQNLEKEWQILSNLNCPQIPQYINWLEDDSAYYLLQQYIEAENLENQLVSFDEIWEIARQILDILDYLSSQNIVHKDIKPENILWNQNQAFLVDFGFSSNLNFQPGASSTFLGTPGFMPPEQIFKGIISHQGDLYSLGVTLFCKLAQAKSSDLPNMLDDNYKLNLNLISHDNSDFKVWLSTITDSNLLLRYDNADSAKNSLPEKLNRIDNSLILNHQSFSSQENARASSIIRKSRSTNNSLKAKINQLDQTIIQHQEIDRQKKRQDALKEEKKKNFLDYLSSCLKEKIDNLKSEILDKINQLYRTYENGEPVFDFDEIVYSHFKFQFEFHHNISFPEVAHQIFIIENIELTLWQKIERFFWKTENSEFLVKRSELIILPALKYLFDWLQQQDFNPLIYLEKDYEHKAELTIYFEIQKGKRYNHIFSNS